MRTGMFFEAGWPETGSVSPGASVSMRVPVHGDEHGARLLTGRDQSAHEHGIETGGHANEIGIADVMARGILRMDLDVRLRAMLRQALAFAGPRHRVPVIAYAAGIER